jgi:hypothetical protein
MSEMQCAGVRPWDAVPSSRKTYPCKIFLTEATLETFLNQIISLIFVCFKASTYRHQRDARSVRGGERVRQGRCFTPILFKSIQRELYQQKLLKNWKFQSRRKSNADDLVLPTEIETVLQGMIERLIEVGKYYRMEINVKKK